MIHRLSPLCLEIKSPKQVGACMDLVLIRTAEPGHQKQMHNISYPRMPPQSCRCYLGGKRFSKEEDSFPLDLHFLTRFFLVSQAIVLACLRPLSRVPG